MLHALILGVYFILVIFMIAQTQRIITTKCCSLIYTLQNMYYEVLQKLANTYFSIIAQ